MRLTSDSALNSMFHRYITPRVLITIMRMFKIIMPAETRSNPSINILAMKIGITAIIRFIMPSLTIVRYCS